MEFVGPEAPFFVLEALRTQPYGKGSCAGRLRFGGTFASFCASHENFDSVCTKKGATRKKREMERGARGSRRTSRASLGSWVETGIFVPTSFTSGKTRGSHGLHPQAYGCKPRIRHLTLLTIPYTNLRRSSLLSGETSSGCCAPAPPPRRKKRLLP